MRYLFIDTRLKRRREATLLNSLPVAAIFCPSRAQPLPPPPFLTREWTRHRWSEKGLLRSASGPSKPGRTDVGGGDSETVWRCKALTDLGEEGRPKIPEETVHREDQTDPHGTPAVTKSRSHTTTTTNFSSSYRHGKSRETKCVVWWKEKFVWCANFQSYYITLFLWSNFNF